MKCEVFFNCIDGQVESPAGLWYFVLFLACFSALLLGLTGSDRRRSPDDVPTPLVFLFIISLVFAVLSTIVFYILFDSIVNRPTETIIGLAAMLITLVVFVIIVLIRRYRWK